MKKKLAILLGISFVSLWIFAQTNTTSTPVVPGTTTPAMPIQSSVSPSNGDQNKQTSTDFLKSNKSQSGVITTKSGLEYKIITAGTGPKPGKNDVVTVDYEGKHLNGQIFDSSYQRGQAATFPVSGVIPGWQEALQLMPVGSTWELYIPAELAYGSRGAPGAIGPNEALVFKVHLISIQK